MGPFPPRPPLHPTALPQLYRSLPPNSFTPLLPLYIGRLFHTMLRPPEPDPTQEMFWRVENSLSDCYPLPNFEREMPLPIFNEEVSEYPPVRGYAPLVSDEYYPLWASRFAVLQSVTDLGQRARLSDLMRYWELLEKAHRQIHKMLDAAHGDLNQVVLGNYTSLMIFHAGVESIMRDTNRRILAFRD